MSTIPTPAPKPWQTHLPNALTLLRVLIAAALFALIALAIGPADPDLGLTHFRNPLILATILFSLAALTDALDGHLARKWHVVSAFGRVMDPFADKLLILGSFTSLAGASFHIPAGPNLAAMSPAIAIAILARELLVTTIRGVYEGAGVDFSANWAGKWKMILQSAAIPIILLLLAFFPCTPGSAQRIIILSLVWVTLIVTLWSGIPYITRAIAMSGRLGKESP